MTDNDAYEDDDDEIAPEGNRIEAAQIDDDYDVAPEGNRIVGARPRAVAEYVAREIAEEPDAIDIDVDERGDEVSIVIRADSSDMGRLIGKRGRVIQALRRVVRAAGASDGIKANVDVAD